MNLNYLFFIEVENIHEVKAFNPNTIFSVKNILIIQWFVPDLKMDSFFSNYQQGKVYFRPRNTEPLTSEIHRLMNFTRSPKLIWNGNAAE